MSRFQKSKKKNVARVGYAFKSCCNGHAEKYYFILLLIYSKVIKLFFFKTAAVFFFITQPSHIIMLIKVWAVII